MTKHPPKFRVRITPRILDDQLPRDPVEIEARVFHISEYNGTNFIFVTDEIKFPYELLMPHMKARPSAAGLELDYQMGSIRFYTVADWSDTATERLSKEESVKFLIEGGKILKGNEDVLKLYKVSIRYV